MNRSFLEDLLQRVAAGDIRPEEALLPLTRLPYTDIGFARLDHHREVRQGLPEAVYAPGKTTSQIIRIVEEMLESPGGGPVLVTRVEPSHAKVVCENVSAARYDASARLLVWRPAAPRQGKVGLLTAGTADLPVAQEAAAVLAALGWAPVRFPDVGVAGLHRLLHVQDRVCEMDVVIVVAGMEGALASLVGGMVASPVIAVPTSVGYGSSFAGVTALLAMTASCAPGVSVVGIDNGYGAACAAARYLNMNWYRSLGASGVRLPAQDDEETQRGGECVAGTQGERLDEQTL